jgi:anti-sigma B factor antagonist
MIGTLRHWHGPRRRRARAEPPPPVDIRPFAVEHSWAGAAEIWAAAGEVDMATKARLQAVVDAIPGSGAPLVIDLTGVTFMDSTGLAVLLRIDRAARNAGRPLAIACPEGPARLVLAVSGVEDELPLYATRAEALAAVGRPGSS